MANQFSKQQIDEFFADGSPAFHVLGLMCFVLGPAAHVYRDAGHAIDTKAEHEQAFMMRVLLGFVAEYGDDWHAEFVKNFAGVKAKAAANKSASPSPEVR